MRRLGKPDFCHLCAHSHLRGSRRRAGNKRDRAGFQLARARLLRHRARAAMHLSAAISKRSSFESEASPGSFYILLKIQIAVERCKYFAYAMCAAHQPENSRQAIFASAATVS